MSKAFVALAMIALLAGCSHGPKVNSSTGMVMDEMEAKIAPTQGNHCNGLLCFRRSDRPVVHAWDGPGVKAVVTTSGRAHRVDGQVRGTGQSLNTAAAVLGSFTSSACYFRTLMPY